MRNPVWMDTLTVNGEDIRLAQGLALSPDTGANAMRSRPGVRASGVGDLLIAAQGSPNNTVIVNPGRCVVNGDTSGTQGAYYCTQDTAITLGPFGDPDRTYDRIDLVVVHVYDKEYIGGSLTQSAVEIVQGSPGASPSVPGTPGNSLALAQVRIQTQASGGAVISAGNITDVRQFTAALGGVIPCTSTTRPAFPFYGMTIYESDTDIVRTWCTTNAWERIGGRRDPRGVIVDQFWGATTAWSLAEIVIGTVAGTCEANRIYEITAGAYMQSTLNNTRAQLAVKDGSISGTILARAYNWLPNANNDSLLITTSTVNNLTAGSHTFVVTQAENFAGAQVQVFGGAKGVRGAWLTIKDIGGT